MNNFKEELLKQEADKIKKKAINEFGAIDFHFQVPNFEHPLMILPFITNELRSYGTSMQEFHTEKATESNSAKETLKHIAHGHMYGIWNTWLTVMGMVFTAKDPELMMKFHEMIKEFAEEQIMKPKQGDN
jgi:hypothetical protein